MNPAQCPACGSSHVVTQEENRTLQVPFGPDIAFKEVIATCQDCGTSGDFEGTNDARFEAAEKKALALSTEKMIATLGALGYSMAYMERALGLPSRTMARWKEGYCSAAGIALLRIVKAFPWILEVAEKGFSEKFAQMMAVASAARILTEHVKHTDIQSAAVGAASSGDRTIAFAALTLPAERCFDGVAPIPVATVTVQ